MPEATKRKSAPKSGTPSYQTFCSNFKYLTEEDLNDPSVQQMLRTVANDPQFPKRVRDLARKFIRGKKQ
jgi:hypothetical protein